MVITIFRSRLRSGVEKEYAEMARRTLDIASRMPGFVSFKGYTAADGERVSIIEFDSEEHLLAWQNHPEHREAQNRGRKDIYEEFRVQVCTPERSYEFKRDREGKTTRASH